jgi:hypothetical protein
MEARAECQHAGRVDLDFRIMMLRQDQITRTDVCADGVQVLTLSFVYKDKSKIQAYLTRKGEFLWYPLMGQVSFS